MVRPSVIRPKRHISQKVRKSGGPTPEQAILRALNAAGDLMESYQGWAVDDLADLWHKFQQSEGHQVTPSEISEMFDVTHEIRGQGGTFGYSLISDIADSLCKFLDGRTSVEAVEFDVIKVHILAMKAVFNQSLKGKQPELSEQLSELLLALRNKVELRRNFRA